ncbi:zinc finger, CCHC-type containing protein [Tanacetum coccineum]
MLWHQNSGAKPLPLNSGAKLHFAGVAPLLEFGTKSLAPRLPVLPNLNLEKDELESPIMKQDVGTVVPFSGAKERHEKIERLTTPVVVSFSLAPYITASAVENGTRNRTAHHSSEAIDDEISSITKNNTWILSDLPPGCKHLGCKWIFKRKMKVNGTIDKFKARLVIQGFRQKEGIDYFDTYAPVARITTIRLLLALAAIHKLVIHQMDVKTTFLNGDLDKEMYMKQPEGFVMPANEHKVCKLVKSLYGLKQAPKQ